MTLWLVSGSRRWLPLTALTSLWCVPAVTHAAEGQIFQQGRLDPQALLQAGGVIGYLIILLSVALVALIVEHLLSIRRATIMPQPLIDEIQPFIRDGHYAYAIERCQQHPSYLGFVLATGLKESGLGFAAVEKAMEEASLEQSARLMRKIDYLSLIGAVAPMMGLLGTVWGMIQAFAEFAEKANPQPGDFAPAISAALVTTLFGLCVAIPATAAYVWFRNRIDEMAAEASLIATHLTGPMKRALADRGVTGRQDENIPSTAPPLIPNSSVMTPPGAAPSRERVSSRPVVPPVVREREPPR